MKDRLTPLMRADDVYTMLNRRDVVIVDARGGADALDRYRQAHLPGAIFADLEKDLSEKKGDASLGGRHPLPAPRDFAITLSKYGIDSEKHVLVYDDKSGANAAARLWWMLKAAGHEKVQVINGGLSAIIRSGVPVSDEVVVANAVQSPYPFEAWKYPQADIDRVTRAQTDDSYLIVDVREGFRYRGESEPIDLIAGHIPGAINLPYTDNLDDKGLFHPPDVLKKRYSNLMEGRASEKVIVHCGSGVTACHTLLAMDYAGMGVASLYVGSWSEWSRNPKPIASGPNPTG